LKFAKGPSSKLAKDKLTEHEGYTCEGPSLGPINRATLMRDPKHLLFTLSRYKYLSKMLTGKEYICEIGCNEATGTLILSKEVKHVTAIDYYKTFIDSCKELYDQLDLNISFLHHDALSGLPNCQYTDDGKYDGVVLMDVLEHIDPKQEDLLLKKLTESLNCNGVAIIGIPSIESQKYASPVSKAHHINGYASEDMKIFLEKDFGNVFMFGMNDEVLHTGFPRMCQYLIALCVTPEK
jgi:2-polyprenyl-3-methyl-5-hydroxy-6-metoxy-1,4-benzoquinol methylase